MERHMEPEPIEILLVEDSDDDIVLVKEAFAQSRLMNLIKVVHDGEEALAYLRQEGEFSNVRLPGLILLDINMPKMNGFEVLDAVKADPVLKPIPVVMLTVSERDTDIVKSYTKGACSYVKKPVNFNKLARVVKEFELYWTLVSTIPKLTR